MGERLPEDWFENIVVYNAEITFTTLEDFGAIISFGESMLPDHVVEFTIDKFTIKSDMESVRIILGVFKMMAG